MSYLNSNESCTMYASYKPQKNPHELFDRIARPKELKLETRPMFLKVGTVSNVKGSAYIEYGNTKVMAQIEPPREINKQTKKNDGLGVVVCSVKYTTFALGDTEDAKHKESCMSMALKKALEPVICRHEFSNFQLEIKVLVLDDDGCALSTAITCCGAALIEGGIPTYDLITASTVCLLKQVEYVNPTVEIEDLLGRLPLLNESNGVEEHGIVITASLASVGQVSECFQKGYLSQKTLERLCEHSLSINQQMVDTVRHVLVNKVRQHLTQKTEEDKKP